MPASGSTDCPNNDFRSTKQRPVLRGRAASFIGLPPAAASACIRPRPAAYALLHAAIYWVLVRFTDSTVPFWDSFTTALCILAYWMLSRRWIEQWLVWLAVDAATVGLYLYKGIPVTAGLYALYSVLAVAGYMRWRRQAAAQ